MGNVADGYKQLTPSPTRGNNPPHQQWNQGLNFRGSLKYHATYSNDLGSLYIQKISLFKPITDGFIVNSSLRKKKNSFKNTVKNIFAFARRIMDFKLSVVLW